MTAFDRRQFMVLTGVGSLASVAGGGGIPRVPLDPSSDLGLESGSLTKNYVLSPGSIAEVVEGRVVGQPMWWAYPANAEISATRLARVIVPQLIGTAGPSDEQEYTWDSETAEIVHLSATALVSSFSAHDVTALLAAAAVRRAKTDVQLEFTLRDTPADTHIRTAEGVPFIGASEGHIRAEGNAPPPSIDMFGWKVQFRGLETHDFCPTCLCPIRITHFHVDLFQALGGGRYRLITTFHLGTYKKSGQRCFVVYNSGTRFCRQICLPSFNDLQGLFVTMIYSAAALAGVGIAAWAVSAVAYAAAAAMYVPLLLLA